MIDPVGYAGADYAELVGDATVMGQPVGNPETTFPMLLPLSFGFEQGRVHFPHCGDGPVEASGKGLAGQFVKQGLGIEKIQVAGSALHEEKNDVFGLSPAMRNLGERRVRGSFGQAEVRWSERKERLLRILLLQWKESPGG